jgi:hypothetical protein
VYREREKEREKERKNREKTMFFLFFLRKKDSRQTKKKKYTGTRAQGSGALVPWYQGSHLRRHVLGGCGRSHVVRKTKK